MKGISRSRQDVWDLKGREDPRNSFQRALCPLFIVGQMFSLMPVAGLRGKDSSSLRFRWMDLRVVYTILSMIGIAFLLMYQTWDLANIKITYSTCAGTIFFSITLTASYMFLRLAMKWPDFVSKWEAVENEMKQHYGYPKHLARTCQISAAVLLTASTVEHLGAIYSVLRVALPCSQGGLDIFRAFYMAWYAPIFRHTPYALWKSLGFQISNFIATFIWSYMDVFVTLVSVALASKFQQINDKLNFLRGKNLPWWQWRQTREHYDSLCSLTQTVDDSISHLVLLCLFSDLYFVCLQLFNSLQNVSGLYGYIFFFYSFGYLLIRASVMCLTTAAVHEASKKPKHVLFSVPSDGYNYEVDRFIDQVTTGQVALTGFRVIVLNRRFFLTVIGSIATYELLLVQQSMGGSDTASNSTNITLVCP